MPAPAGADVGTAPLAISTAHMVDQVIAELHEVAVRKEARFRRWFRIALAIKGIDGALETIGGTLLLFVAPDRLNEIFLLATARELSNHPDDWIGRAIVHASQAFSVETQKFASFYLIGHGLVKLLLVSALWREKRWAFPVALWFLGIFVIYQLYRFTHTHSPPLILFSAFDIFVLWAVWRDRQLLRIERATA